MPNTFYVVLFSIFEEISQKEKNITRFSATAHIENNPFDDSSFDNVYSSHVLEHVNDINQCISEIKRVTVEDGIIIIGVPTSTMALISWITQVLFTTHQNIINVLFYKFINTSKTKWWEIFIPKSHSYENKTIFNDIRNYREKKWLKIVEKELKIVKIIRFDL